MEEQEEEQVEANFVELVHTMLKDPEVKQQFFTVRSPLHLPPELCLSSRRCCCLTCAPPPGGAVV